MKAGSLLVLFLATALIAGFHGFFFQSLISLFLLLVLLSLAYPFALYLVGRGTAAIVFTFPIGYILHALFLSIAGLFFGINAVTFSVYSVIFAVAAIAMYRKTAPEAPSNDWNGSAQWILLLWLAISLAALAIPFIRVGTHIDSGVAYRAYFNTDFFRHMAVAANLANHGIPPDNPYFSGITLRYYWFFHIIPAYWIRLFPSYSLDYMMVQFNLIVALMFAGSMFAAIRHFTTRMRSRIILLALFLAGGSYEGIYLLYHFQQKGLSWSGFRDFNIDAILRWFWNAPQVDTLFRSMLYAPQHLIGLCFFLLSLLCWKSATRFFQRMLIYILLFSVTGFTVIIAGALILGSAVMLVVETVKQPRQKILELVTAGALGIGFLAAYFFMFQMFGTSGGEVKFEVNRKVLQNIAGYFVLNWGAILIAGIAGIFRRTTTIPVKTLLSYLALCILFIFFVNIDVPGSSEITLKMGFLSYVILLIFAAGFVDAVNFRTSVVTTAMFVILIPAFLTWGMDLYNNQDIHNSKFTTVIPEDDAEVYRWMKENIEPEATAQNYTAGASGFLEEYVTEIPAMAERTVYLGDKVHSKLYQISDEDLETRNRIVWKIFHLSSPGQISAASQRAGIEYLWLPTRDTLKAFEAHLVEPYFSLAKKQRNARLYRVNHRSVSTLEMEQHVLVQDQTGKVLLRCEYEKNFYQPEMQTGLETARWMSDDALIKLEASQPLRGTLSFTAYSFEGNRELELLLNGNMLIRKAISPKGARISLPVEFQAGQNELTFNAVAAPSLASDQKEGDNRLLSFRIWNLQYSTRPPR